MSDIETLSITSTTPDEEQIILKSDDNNNNNNTDYDDYYDTDEDDMNTDNDSNSNSTVLNWEQVKKLDKILNFTIPIHGRGNYPTLNVCLKEFIRNLYKKLIDAQILINSIRINGGVASYILAETTKENAYSDIDIIFACNLLNETTNNCDLIKECVFKCLLDYLPDDVNKSRVNLAYLKDAYVMKMVKVLDNDCWSLISLCNNEGQNIDLKFVHRLKRQFQFSVDSFQIHLDSLLYYYNYQEQSQQMNINENFYPTVIAESVYGSFGEAKYHLDNKLIATRSPEEIRGGGLLKYCNLLVRGYKAADVTLMKLYEKYMCSRFFIDFSDINTQKYVLMQYLDSHFQQDDDFLLYNYLMKLYEIVNKSTVCLMNHERGLTLDLIISLAIPYQFSYQQTFLNTFLIQQQQQQQHNRTYRNTYTNTQYLQPQQQQQTYYYDELRPPNSCISSLSASPFHSPSQSPLPFSSSSSSILLSSSTCSSPSPSPVPNYNKNLNVNSYQQHQQQPSTRIDTFYCQPTSYYESSCSS